MEIKDLKGKLVAVAGFGLEGKAVAKYLIKHGIKPVLFDQKPWEEIEEVEKSEIKSLGVNFIFGPDCFKELAGFDVVFRSPGVKADKLTGWSAGQLVSQTRFFFHNCPAKIIGVTGTKGKGTTSSLIYEILSAAPKKDSRIFLTGNIGKTQALEILDDLKPDDWVVYELSSFQLQDLDKSPHISVVLMVTSEHLDYHKNTQEYVEAKSIITKFQKEADFAIVNADYENSIIAGENGDGRKLYFSTKGAIGADCFVKDGEVISEISNFKFSISKLQLRGQHNWENICAAILAAQCAKVDNNTITSAISDFKGLEHRLEFVAEKNGIKFYNDSFSTVPETAIAAIKAFEEPEILILGGSSKNSDFTELGHTIVVTDNIKALILIGDEAKRIQDSITQAGGFNNFILTGAKNMSEVFEHIKSVAHKGDVVILSPACASFGMFKNYKDRGERFKEQISNF